MAVLWLFGEIWLWLLVAFGLGALTTWLVMRQRERAAERPDPGPYAEPPTLATEETQYIPTPYEPEPEYEHHHYLVEDEPYEQEPYGHREGHLPMPPPRPAQDDDWPSDEQPAWPRAEDVGQQWRQPGRGG